MSVHEIERSRRRRIVFGAMNGHATPSAIQVALKTLETEFGDVENLRYNQLITRLQQTLDAAEANLGKILGNIMTLRQLPDEQIGPDPLPGGSRGEPSSAALTTTPTAAVRRDGIHAVFAGLIETIAVQLQRRGDDSDRKLCDAILKTPQVTALGDRVAGSFARWAASPAAGTLDMIATIDQYRVIVHVAYVWLCKTLGPVDADRMLMSGVRQAELLPDAVAHPPRQLL